MDEFLDIFLVNSEPFGLKIGTFVPVDAQPFKGVKDGIDRGLGRALGISVLNPQDKMAVGVPGIQPVEKGCAGATHVKVAGGAGRKASDCFSHCSILTYGSVDVGFSTVMRGPSRRGGFTTRKSKAPFNVSAVD